MIFRDRSNAGQLLAKPLQKYKSENPIVLALPRGGVPVALEIANALDAPLEVLIVRKIGAPFQNELAIGAICEDEEPIWNETMLSRMELEPDDLGITVGAEIAKIKHQTDLFRNGRKFPSVVKKTAIVVDDGLATGATMAAAIKFLRKKGAAKIVVAVPVSAADSTRKLRNKVDDFIVLEDREDLMSVGQWYHDFSQTSDDDVIHCLKLNQSGAGLKKTARELIIPVDQVNLTGDLTTFPAMKAVIIFAHGSGSSRKSPRNQQVARYLNDEGFGTLLFDLLTDDESKDRRNAFNIDFLSNRLASVTQWLREQPNLDTTPFAFFGASTGAGAAIQAASLLIVKNGVYAIVSRGGRPDLAGHALSIVTAPTLLLVGGNDVDVIDLNRQAQKLMVNCELSIVPEATHLFEEPGALEEVSKQAADWFNNHLPQEKNKKSNVQMSSTVTLEKAIESSAIPIRTEDDFEQLIQSIKDKRVVMLGEASHGTEEFYQLRSLISKRLIKDYGYKFIAVEGDWPDAYRLNKYIQTGEGGNAKSVLMHNHRWPTWMWANEEIAKLAEWMKVNKAGFYGLDVYSLFDSIDEVVNYLKKNNPEFAEDVSRRYACFDPFEGNEISYARSLLAYPSGCESEVVQNLQKLLKLRVKDGDDLFSAQQNAHIVANAESYYRAMIGGDAKSWNVRDGHMMETLDRLLERFGEGAKGIVWAHNTHIGDYRATDMKAAGYVNIGGLARQSYGEENIALVGFGTYQGDVLAGSAWGAPEQVMPLPPAQEESFEYYFHKSALKAKVNQLFVLLDDKRYTAFIQKRGHRAVGVVYDPRHEKRGNYVPTELSKRYDAFVFVDTSHALKSLNSPFVYGKFPETWPSGQ